MGHIDQDLSQAFELFGLPINYGLNTLTQPVGSLGVENREQAAAPRQLNTEARHQLMGHDPVSALLPAPQAALPPTVMEGESMESDGTTR